MALKISVAPNTPAVLEGQLVVLTATVTGGTIGTGPVRYDWQITNGAYTYTGKSTGTTAQGVFTWDTGGAEPGHYTVTASLTSSDIPAIQNNTTKGSEASVTGNLRPTSSGDTLPGAMERTS